MDKFFLFILMYVAFAAGVLTMSIIDTVNTEIDMKQEVADDICYQLTGNKSAEASMEMKKFVCELPSFDSTQNIIVRTNAEE